MSVSINIDKVVKRFGNETVINGLSLNIKPGELFTLLGPSGCGKTTLLRMIIGFNSIEDGKIEIDNKVVNDIPVNKRKMGMVFQNYAIFPHMSVADNIAFGLKVNNLSKAEINKRMEDIMKVVRIEAHKSKKPDKLSGGQQQRVALARALVIHPKVLLMDEPLSNLDAKLRIEMRNAIKAIQQQVGITTVYVTHDQEEALAISDRIAVMNGGVIQQIGKPEDIYSRPSNLFVAQFIGTSNVIKGKIETDESGGVFVRLNENYKEKMDNLSEIKKGQEVIVAVRPQEFILVEDESSIKGVIESTMFLGLNTHYFVKLDTGEKVEVIQDAEANEIMPEGTRVHLKLKSKKINLFDSATEESLIKAGG
ncbi:iron(III) transport system ATP-binding protein [Evansella vedderi]|uniref:Iron(III) transport system ATP-binding protein n=1 Tax=Evansella vedderi TaxID=38282 RepID=A0ABT9ZPW6_9BACI|nr:ABC transporter ATP-binding protein [Evansella vedderi]MDQ0253281.1 iron(III) transport system ATP-binding protein [Evansella vedderi]